MRRSLSALFVAVVATTFVVSSPAIADSTSSAGMRNAPSSIKVCIVPLGPYDRGLTKTAVKGIEYLFGFKVQTKRRRALPKHSYYPPRKRYRADKLLDWLEAKVVPAHKDCRIVLGFTRVDISVTKGKHKDWGIFGLGSVGGTVAVVSTYRMKRVRSWRTIKQRMVKVVNHELGHVLGLPHYTGSRKGCLMESAHGTVATVDNETGLLCPESIATIESRMKIKLPKHTRFDWRKVL